jgi:hypothetical protein
MLLDRLGITLPKRLRIDEIELPITLSGLTFISRQNVSADFRGNPLICLGHTLDSAQVRLGNLTV